MNLKEKNKTIKKKEKIKLIEIKNELNKSDEKKYLFQSHD